MPVESPQQKCHSGVESGVWEDSCTPYTTRTFGALPEKIFVF